jgi:uncharacterized membrane protein
MEAHSHSHADAGPAPASGRVKWLLAGVMAVFVLATYAGAFYLWPRDVPGKDPWLAEGAALLTGTVVGITEGTDGGYGSLAVELEDGTVVTVPEDPTAPVSEARVGQGIEIVRLDAAAGAAGTYFFFDYERGWPLLALAGVFALAVVAVARWKGLAALAGLAAALAVIWVFTLPALTTGGHPLAVALTTAAMVMFVVVYLAHGISVKTTTALLGTFAGVAAVALLAWVAIRATSLTPLQDDTLGQLPYRFPGLDVRGILLCGMVLAGVGVLNDVTITQASAVWELRAAAPAASRRTVFSHAMRIGRDHIASTVYTIAFAYVGTALGLLLLASRLDFTVLALLQFNTIAQELVATLVASIALVLTIPITTALGAWLAAPLPAPPAGAEPTPPVPPAGPETAAPALPAAAAH